MTGTPNRKVQKLILPKFPKILNVYFWEDNVYFGEIVFIVEITFTFGYYRRFFVFGTSFLLLPGLWDPVGRGGPVGGFENTSVK